MKIKIHILLALFAHTIHTFGYSISERMGDESCPTYAILVTLSPSSTCPGEPVTATFTFPGGTPGMTYDVEWGDVELSDISSGHTMTFSPTTTTTYVIDDVEDDNDCEPSNLPYSFTLVVDPPSSVSPASDNPSVCLNSPMPDIVFSTQNATGITSPSGLPLGVNAVWMNNTISVSGTPQASGVYNYSISLEGCGNTTATGQITVNGQIDIIPQIDTVCQGDTFNQIILNQGSFQKVWVKKLGESSSDSIPPYTINNVQYNDQISIEALDLNGCMSNILFLQPVYLPIDINIPDTSYYCSSTVTELAVSEGYDSYLWYDTNNAPLSTSSNFTLTENNLNEFIYLTVQDTFGCAAHDTTFVLASEDCCTISATASNIVCNDNGTPLDPSDDTFTFDILVTGSNTSTSWSANDPLNASGSYNTTLNLGPFPISGGDLNFVVTDAENDECSTSIMVEAPQTCSTSCAISTNTSNIVCNDNGTPIDPSDDTFTFDILVTGSNTSTSWSANDPLNSSGSFNTTMNLGPFPISEGNLSFVVTDAENDQCSSTIMVEAPQTCSTSCAISANTSNIICNDNGTPIDPSDDTFTFDILVTGSNTSATWSANDPLNSTGGYNSTLNLGPFPISSGDLNFTITDSENNECTTTVAVQAPQACSDDCGISANASNIICNDNGTPIDPSDDTFTFDIIVTGSNAGASWSANDPSNATGGYNTTVNLGPFPISGGDLDFTITDANNNTCTTTVAVTAPQSCSDECAINVSTSNIVCNDNNTPQDPSDDTFTFDIIVSGSNTSSSWTANDSLNSTGGYNSTLNLGPFPISGGDLNFTITDDNNNQCTTTVSVQAPQSCSDACTINASTTNIVCNDNNTPQDPSDDTFTFDIFVSGSNTGSSWSANDPLNSTGGYNSTLNLGPFPISGGDLNFTITDDNNNQCTTTVSVQAPQSCSDACTINASTTNIICNDNNTPHDTSDDTFTFDIIVSGDNTSTSWTANDPLNSTGSYNNTLNLGPFPKSSGDLNFTITDAENSTCTTTVEVEAPDSCSDSEPICSDLAAFQAEAVTIENSACAEGCFPTGGIIKGITCPEKSKAEYSSDGGNSWSSQVPEYNQSGPIQSIVARCSCIEDENIVSRTSSEVSTLPEVCAPLKILITPDNTESYCLGEQIELRSTISGGSSPYQYIWNGDESLNLDNYTYTPESEGTHEISLQVTDSNGCTDQMKITFQVQKQKSAGTDNKVEFCPDTDAVIKLYDHTKNADQGGKWLSQNNASISGFNAASGTLDLSKVDAGSYIFTYTFSDTSPCPSTSSTLTISIVEKPFTLQQSYVGDSLQLSIDGDPNTIQTIEWKTSSGTTLCKGGMNDCNSLMWNAYVTETISVEITSDMGCIYNESIGIEAEDCHIECKDDEVFAEVDTWMEYDPTENDILAGDLREVNVIDASRFVEVDTSTTRQNLSFSTTKATGDTLWIRYEASLSNCTKKDTATVYILHDIWKDIVLPNFIHPNGDGYNDVLRFNDEEKIDDSELWIYNRYGDRIYYQKKYTNDWNASIYPGGIYYYILSYKAIKLKRMLIVSK